jgi:CPA2 family monovalent cation:H+ antiporter-2
VGKAFASARVAFLLAIAALGVCGWYVFDPLFDWVMGATSQEAFVGLVLATALGMSFLTEGLGLSNTLGSFASRMILTTLRHREKIKAEKRIRSNEEGKKRWGTTSGSIP